MTEIVKVERKKVLEPTEVLAPGVLPSGYAHSNDIRIRTWNLSPLMRRLGYTRNPDNCRHERKCYQPSFGWWCKDCGDSLRMG